MNSGVWLQYKEQRLKAEAGESVLDVLLKQGHEVPFGCRSGVCQSCIMESRKGDPGKKAQQGLKPGHQAMNYFMACQCQPSEDMEIVLPGMGQLTQAATVISKEYLRSDIVRLLLRSDIECRPGQYFTLWRNEKTGRSYSLASVSDKQELSFHIKVIESGRFSAWLAEQVQVGDTLNLQGPMGSCFYQTPPDKPMLLAGIGTGLAPLYGVLTEALSVGHQEKINLVLGASDEAHFYFREELVALDLQYSNLHVHWVAQKAEIGAVIQASIYDYLAELMPDMSGVQVYLCGAESFVHKMKRQCFLAGASMNEILSDAFVAS
ncbi:MAG: hypothetical protein C9356_00855 [Oleiphilus sp.]|nr:MAG: hypothetical protein C9356_00855 [Oleiphilus sp.]